MGLFKEINFVLTNLTVYLNTVVCPILISRIRLEVVWSVSPQLAWFVGIAPLSALGRE